MPNLDLHTGIYMKAVKPIPVYNNPDSKELIETIPVGQTVGKLYSWVTRGNEIWWMFEFSNGGYYYAKNIKGHFSPDITPDDLFITPATEPFKIPDSLKIAAILFTGFQAATSKTPAGRFGWGAGAALIAGQLIYSKLSNVDFNPF